LIALDHINIHAVDHEAVRDFLIAVLGVTPGWRPPFDFTGYWLYLGDRPIIHIQGRKTAPGAGWLDHVAFGPFDFETQKARLQAGGFSYRESAIPGTALRQLFVEGPEGIKLELQCREEGAPGL
jgi:catechol 2,3-dioxygenase-like lactoylglutathione lyase family enzyme